MEKIEHKRQQKKILNKYCLVCGQYIGHKMKSKQDLKPIKVDVSNNFLKF